MPIEQTDRERAAPEGDRAVVDDQRAVRELATRQVERVHAFKLHAVAFLVGTVALGIVWMLTEYFQDGTWPSRFADADDGRVDTWNPWFFYAVAVWLIVLGVHALKTFGRRPPTEAEIQREMERIKGRR
jgi:2TM domain